MERSDTVPDVLTAPKEELPLREDIGGESVMDRMMRMCLSLRAELYDLYRKHQALLDENKAPTTRSVRSHALNQHLIVKSEPLLTCHSDPAKGTRSPDYAVVLQAPVSRCNTVSAVHIERHHDSLPDLFKAIMCVRQCFT